MPPRALIEAYACTPAPLALLDDHLRLLYANPSFERECAHGQPHERFLAPITNEELTRLLTSNRPFHARHLEPNGHALRLQLGSLRLAEGTFVIAALEPVPNGVGASGDPASEIQKLREQDQFKTQFINTAAHELGTPLTPIKIQLHLLRETESQNFTEFQRNSIEILTRNFDRLAGLIGEILDVSRLSAHRLSVQRTPIELNQVVAQAAESFQAAYDSAGIRLSCQATTPNWVDADAARISQVLFNFLSNALKFTPRGGSVQLRTERHGEHARVLVIDTGNGLTDEQISRLFKPFSQVHDTSQRSRAGSGLGLFISKGIIELHEGRIWCESDGPGEGSTFAFELPLRSGDIEPHERIQIEQTTRRVAQASFNRRLSELI